MAIPTFHTKRRRTRPVAPLRVHRAFTLAAVLIGVVLSAAAVSACGSSGPKVANVTSPPSAGAARGSSSTNPSSTNPALASVGHKSSGPPLPAADAYAVCLRDHGMSNYPAPQLVQHGLFTYVPLPNTGSGLPLDAPQVVKAAHACARQRAAIFGPPTAAQVAALRSSREKVASCMHAHGFPGYPSPVINSAGAETDRIPEKVTKQPGFNKAYSLCSASAS